MPASKANRGNRTERRGHRPPHVPTDASRRQVEALASFGVPQENIAKVIEVGEKTLRKYYAGVLATAEIKANSLVAQSLFNKATKGEGSASVTAAIFWLKTRARWKETLVNEHTGKDGEAISAVHRIERVIIRPDQKGVSGLLAAVEAATGPGAGQRDASQRDEYAV